MKVSPGFRRAAKREVRRLQADKRAIEAADSSAAAKDIQAGRRGLVEAERSLGYATTELNTLARESGNRAVTALAGKLKSVMNTMTSLGKDLEKIHQQVNRLR